MDDVYDALTTLDGLSGWWTTDTTGDTEVDGVIKFRFGPGGFDMGVRELQPASSSAVGGRRRTGGMGRGP